MTEDLLTILDPWWKQGKVSSELAAPYKRKVFSKIKELLKTRQIVVISGLRRVGKSTLMYQMVEDLINSGVNPENVLYFSFDEKTERPLDVLDKYSELTKVDWKKEKCFIFFDEVQKTEEWSNKIKIIYDSFPNLKMIVSGSSSFQLEKEAKINLAGRHFVVYVEPLSFTEYLELKGSEIDLKKPELWKNEIRKEVQNFLLRPFPELVSFKEPSLIKSYIKDSVIEKILRAYLSERFKHVNEDLLTRLVDIFYGSPGAIINYDDLSKELKVSKQTLIQHIFYLEFAYVLRRIKNFRPHVRTTSRKLQRIYPFHWSLGFGWTGNINFETIVASLVDAKHYWREGEKEVDFLIGDKQILPIEVKESLKVNKSELKPLLFFMKKFNIKKSLVVYNGEEGKLKVDGILINMMPLWKLFLTRPES